MCVYLFTATVFIRWRIDYWGICRLKERRIAVFAATVSLSLTVCVVSCFGITFLQFWSTKTEDSSAVEQMLLWWKNVSKDVRLSDKINDDLIWPAERLRELHWMHSPFTHTQIWYKFVSSAIVLAVLTVPLSIFAIKQSLCFINKCGMSEMERRKKKIDLFKFSLCLNPLLVRDPDSTRSLWRLFPVSFVSQFGTFLCACHFINLKAKLIFCLLPQQWNSVDV